MPATDEVTAILPGLSPIHGRAIEARFDSAMMSSDGGLLVLREIEQRLGIAKRLAACLEDPRAPERVVHGLDEIIRFRLLMIAAGYEDGNNANNLRRDPAFKLALDRLPDGAGLCSQSTISRLENLPDSRALLRMGRTLVDLYCAGFRQVPRRIVLDIDDTFDAVHGEQQLRLFNAHYDEYGFQPIVVFDDRGRFVTAILRPAKRPAGVEIRAHLRRIMRQIRANWPNVEILLRADSHYCCPEVLDGCRVNRLDYVLGLAPTSTLKRHTGSLEASTAARFAAHHAALVRDWLKQSGRRIVLHFIPPYCPHLDPIERCWGVMHENTTHNRCYGSFAEFKTAVMTFLTRTVPAKWDQFRDRITDNFRVISPKDFRIMT